MLTFYWKGDITVIVAPQTQVAFKNFSRFTKWFTKFDGTKLDDAEDLDLVMPIYNLIKYSSNYSETTGSLCFYWKDEATNFNTDVSNTDNFKSLKYKAKLLGNTFAQPGANTANGILQIVAIAVPLK